MCAWVTVTTPNGSGLPWFRDKATSLTVAKGDRVYVEGRLKLESWTAKDSAQRSGLKVAAWKVERIGEIGKNKPTEKKAPAESAQARGNSNGDRRPPARDWQQPGADGDEIPY